MKKYGNDYRPGEKGYEYTGNWYEAALQMEQLKKRIIYSAVELALMSAAFVLALTQKNGGSYVLWILSPFVGIFLPLAYGWMGLYDLWGIYKKKKTRLNQAEYDRGIRRPWRCGVGMAVLSGISCLADLIYMIRQSVNIFDPAELIFITAGAMLFAISFIYTVQNRAVMKKIHKLEKIEA